jgi:hypothetical protein
MALPASVHVLERELRDVFGSRLQSLVAYGLNTPPMARHAPVRTLALVESLSAQDLRACADKVKAWHGSGLATPLLIASAEFERSLDVFPLEFGAIIADHQLVAGSQPFAQSRVEAADLRRACEVQARSHLLHLREGFLDGGGNGHALAMLIVASAAPLTALLTSVARLDGRSGSDAAAAARHAERLIGVTEGFAAVVTLATVHEISAEKAEQLFPPYLAATEKLVAYVDGWSAA